MRSKMTQYTVAAVATFLLSTSSIFGVDYPGTQPGPVRVQVQGKSLSVGNQVLSATWHLSETGIQDATFTDLTNKSTWGWAGEPFRITMDNGTVYRASNLHPMQAPLVTDRSVSANSDSLASRTGGKQVEIRMKSQDGRLAVLWRAIMLDGTNYVRQEIEVSASGGPLKIQQITWLSEPSVGAVSGGSVDGSPVTVRSFFAGCEDPMAENRVVPQGQSQATENDPAPMTLCQLSRNSDLLPGESLTLSFVVGVAPTGQMRRAFLYYLEHERAHPYRPFLHYNSWYDIAWQPFALNESNCLEAIKLFGEKLIRRHHVVFDAMVFDDGWDDPKTLWQFHDGFPHGFQPLADMCRDYGTHLGVWLSPFGGYGEPKEKRLAFGRQQGYETNATGFSLAGPKYYQAFKQACVRMIHDYGVNYFKFDGIAKGMSAQGAGEYVRDTEAMRRLMLELRQEEPSLYINFTTGSWPSPFWLGYADSLWRQGGDMGFAGPGPKQQQWLTYRDQEIYRNIVCRAPLYPLNSLMTQGVAYSRQGYAGDPTFTPAGFQDDVHAFFGSGTSLQELYVQPGKLTDDDWSVLAEAAKWSRDNADVLVDTHWIGGDPGQRQVYGFASWSLRKGIIMLRNPDIHPHEYLLDVQTAFELPCDAATGYALKSPWAADVGKSTLHTVAGKPVSITLQPFEVMVWGAWPVQ